MISSRYRNLARIWAPALVLALAGPARAGWEKAQSFEVVNEAELPMS